MGAASFSIAGLSAASADSTAGGAEPAATGTSWPIVGLGPVRHVRTDLLDLAYHAVGPANGHPVILCHGWPYSPDAYQEVVPELVRKGFRCYVPYLRGHGPTRFLAKDTVRSGQQAALGSDVIAFMDALNIRRAVFGGYDWGGRGLCVAAALWPERCAGLVSVNSYLIQDLDPAVIDLPTDPPQVEAAHWYYYYFLTQRGAAGLAKYTKELARVVWTRNSPEWRYTEADLDRAAALFDNPDYVAVVLNCYRVRRLAAPGDPRYDELEERLLKQPPITVPAVTLDGKADGSLPWTDGTASAAHFTGPRVHHVIPHAGHNLPQEAPAAFAAAVLEVSRLRSTTGVPAAIGG
ncbi:alpha/beta fold hydrolase [Kitasatospora sp. NPDC052896]|uniref:alpha/beta fold hydrolase n=1 Tax=Kitasatospora sp. NPDC052896 TaxID=3364061 RepID=UPI0037C89C7B